LGAKNIIPSIFMGEKESNLPFSLFIFIANFQVVIL